MLTGWIPYVGMWVEKASLVHREYTCSVRNGPRDYLEDWATSCSSSGSMDLEDGGLWQDYGLDGVRYHFAALVAVVCLYAKLKCLKILAPFARLSLYSFYSLPC